jgi:hypothetical protein
MTRAVVGREAAAIGILLGVIAIFVDYASVAGQSLKYSDDGTILAFLLVTLILAAIALAATFTGQAELEPVAAVSGSAACGFFLFVPASLGFNHFDLLSTGAWLGVCTALIPLGLWLSMSAQPGRLARPALQLAVPAIVGRVLCLVAIWLTAEQIGPVDVSYWNLLDQGRALPALMLLLVIGGAALGALTTLGTPNRVAVDGVLILGAVTFGLYSAEVIGSAFNEFGSIGAGGWLGFAGAALLLIGVASIWSFATRPAEADEPAPALSPPAA